MATRKYRAENERLRKALSPFVAAWNASGLSYDWKWKPVRVEYLAKAYEALNKTEGSCHGEG